MPSKSKSQFKLVQTLRTKYGKELTTPDKFKWVWKDDWTDVNYSNLPEVVEKESKIFNLESSKEIKEFFIKNHT